jgi:Domain of unknown function (DUF4383)
MAGAMRQNVAAAGRPNLSPPGQNIAPPIAFIVGVVYLVVGLVGFVATGFDGFTANDGDTLLGFDVNIFHNIVHLAIGLGLIVFSRLDPVITQGVLIGGGLVYLLAAGLGFLNELQILSIDDSLAADNFLHLVTGSAAVLVGLIGARQSASARARTARA